MKSFTRTLWARQNQHPGDRLRLFGAVAETIDAQAVLYPGSYVDVAPSFVFPSVTYIDSDARAARFFADEEGVRQIIEAGGGRPDTTVRFVHSDYSKQIGVPDESADLLVSLYAGFVSEHCTRYLQSGGTLLVNPSHGDAAMASVDARYRLTGVVIARDGGYRVRTDGLAQYLVPKAPIEVTRPLLHERGRGIAYTKSAFAYLFRLERDEA